MSTTLLNVAVSELLFDEHAASTGNSSDFALPSRSCLVSWQFWFGTDPDAVSIQILTSLDGTNFNVTDSDTTAAGTLKTFQTSAKFIRARIDSITSGDKVSLIVIAKPIG